MFTVVALCALALQLISASVRTRSFETPNRATDIARNLAERGEYAAAMWRTTPDATGRVVGAPLRAYILPGEPLYLAAGFRWLPASLHRYLHVPVTVLLVLATAAMGFLIGGRAMALATGALAAFDPFVVVHGPVWDDTFLAAALEWSVLAFLLSRFTNARAEIGLMPLVLLAIAAGFAAVTRLQSQVLLGLIALAAMALPRLKPIRRTGFAIAAGIVLAVSAWGFRNFLVLGVFLLGTSHDGQTLLHGNHPRAREALFETGLTQTYAEMSVPDGLAEIEENRVFRDRGLDYLMSQPVEASITAALKTAVSLTGLDLSRPLLNLRNLATLLPNVSLWLLAGWGVRRWWRLQKAPLDARATFLCLTLSVVTLVTLGMLAIGPVGLRYRISLAPVLYLFAAFGVLAIRRRHAD